MPASDLSDVLSEFAQTMVTDFPIQGILDHLVTRIVDILPLSAAGVTLVAPGLKPRYVAASDSAGLGYETLQTDLGEGPCLAAFATGKAISVPDLSLDDRFPRFAPRALESGLSAVFTFPLRHRSLQLGALDLYRDTVGPLSEESMTAAQTLADVAASYLFNAQARSDLQDSSDQSRGTALHDALTGLPNRVLILELLEHAVRAARRSGRILAVFLVDLDRFKRVNDTYGHRVGDELLVAVAERLTSILRPGDSLARLSGDQFAILCEGLQDPSGADPIAARVEAELSRSFVLSEVEVEVTANIGIAFTGGDIAAPEELLHDADLAMYRSKRAGTGRHGVVDMRGLDLARHQAGLAHGLPGAISRGELHLVYQPIVSALGSRIVGVEALLRWTHPSRGAVAPRVFIPLAEQSGQIVELGRWVLEDAWSSCQRWQQPKTDRIAISVNVSTQQFMSAGFADTVAAVLAGTPGNPGLLTLEVTETVFLRDNKRAVVVMGELKEIGVQLALDDFGTGYSSLGYLNALPIDTIKVDQTFITNLSDNSDSQAIAFAIIQLAHRLGMTALFEGVETADQHHELTKLGSDFCQGFYFARPMPVSAMDALIQRRRPVAPSSRPGTDPSPEAPGG